MSASSSFTTDQNEVRLRGRISKLPQSRMLPSGDVLWSFRLLVSRPPGLPGAVDVIDCSSMNPRVIRTLERCVEQVVLEVEGRLQRRFWRGPAGVNSRYEVAVDVARIKARP